MRKQHGDQKKAKMRRGWPKKKEAKVFPGNRMNRVKLMVLEAMSDNEGWSVRELSDYLNYDFDVVKNSVKYLLRYGYVKKHTARRSRAGEPYRYYYTMNPSGRRLLYDYRDRIFIGRLIGIGDEMDLCLGHRVPGYVYKMANWMKFEMKADGVSLRGRHGRAHDEICETYRLRFVQRFPDVGERIKEWARPIIDVFYPNWPRREPD